jgi:hypothetical protein
MDVNSFLCVSLGSSIAQLHESLGNRSACAWSEAVVSVVKTENILEECTIEEQRSVVRFFCAQKD